MTKNKLRILFISRAYPPVLGGIENQNYGIAKYLSEITPTTIIANKKGKKFLPFFIPWALLKALFLFRKHDALLLGDGVLGPIGAFLGAFFPHKKIFCIIHGLDITYAQKDSIMGKVYRHVNIPSLKTFNRLIMVGNQTIRAAVKAGLPRERCIFIPNGTHENDVHEPHTRTELDSILGIDTSQKTVILRVGRYVEHKGVEWFIRNVVPKLPNDHIFIAAGGTVSSKTAGDQDYFPLCKKTIQELDLQDRVHLLTNLPWKDLKILFNTVDMIVSPNIRVPGSMEGFGINAIEGAICKKIVIASDLDGLKDAIKDAQNGYLVEPGNSQAFAEKIRQIATLDTQEKTSIERSFQQYTIQHYSWRVIAKQYLDEMSGSKE